MVAHSADTLPPMPAPAGLPMRLLEPPRPTAPVPRNVTLPPQGRRTQRANVTLKAWLMSPQGSERGYALDLSETGARLGGMGRRFAVGEKALLKLMLAPDEVPVVVRAELMRFVPVAEGQLPRELAVRFLDLDLDDWFRIARFVDGRRG